MFGRIKISPADKYFSLFIRYRDKRCMRCGKVIPVKELQNSHYFGRTKKSVRWDEQNCDALCFGCHRYWEKEDREGYRVFKVKQLGQQGFDLLQIRANTIDKSLDERLIAMYYRKQLKQYEVL